MSYYTGYFVEINIKGGLNMKIMKEVTVAIAISGGKYLTAVNRGGMGEKENLLSIHTDAKAIGPWEEFSFENVMIHM